MVLVAKRLNRGPIHSSVGAFAEVFSMADSRLKSIQGWSNPRVVSRLAHVSLVMTSACLSSKAIKREPIDLGGCVMSREDLSLARKGVDSAERVTCQRRE